MQVKNSKDVSRGYWSFSLYLASCVAVGVCAWFSYLRTSEIEVKRIVDKTKEYDAIYLQQTDITFQIDTLYRYAGLFNSNLNDERLQGAVSWRKQAILAGLDKLDRRDVRLHRKLMGGMNTFLNAKDSIRILRDEETMIKSELRKCMEENRQASRKITIGGEQMPNN
ncbi:MAG: type VI secretion system transmembrane protein TssQ [Dysgonamonadaceae bacterium]|jgi:hypothetical protein|nr:type VI secretion system transmembrane protein TssQ [Dysgonamonadaceae bacterium]